MSEIAPHPNLEDPQKAFNKCEFQPPYIEMLINITKSGIENMASHTIRKTSRLFCILHNVITD